LVVAEDASAGKATSQSGTVRGRSAEYAVDGNTSTTDPSTCSSAIVVEYKVYNAVPAWWQVNMGDFYLVNRITVYFPTTGQGQYRLNDLRQLLLGTSRKQYRIFICYRLLAVGDLELCLLVGLHCVLIEARPKVKFI